MKTTSTTIPFTIKAKAYLLSVVDEGVYEA